MNDINPNDIEALREDLALYIYEGHKDAFGVKGRHYRLWDGNGKVAPEWTLERLREEADSISAAVEASIKTEHEMELEAIREFEEAVQRTIEAGAGNRETAIRWLREADDDVQYQKDDGYFEYCNGLPYGYLKGEDRFGTGWKARAA